MGLKEKVLDWPVMSDSKQSNVDSAGADAVIFSENRGWFDKLSPERQAEVLRAERERAAAMRADGIEPLGPGDFDR